MSLARFKEGLYEEYQYEVTGEAFFSALLERFDSPRQQYRLATLLQLETETKARLRPALLQLGIGAAESEDYRRKADGFLAGCEGMEWTALMTYLADAVEPFVQRYREIAGFAPAGYREVAESMVVHEASIRTFAQLEAAGDTERSLADVIDQLRFPLVPPR